MAQGNKKSNVFQAIKFALFSASAGIIQIVTFTLLNEVVIPNLNIQSEALKTVLSAEYGVCYLVALVLSVLWNFTFNRKFTFKSAANIKVAMLKIFGFYCVFTPVSTIIGEAVTRNIAWEGAEYVVLACTMATNMISEFLFCKFVVYKGNENTNSLAQKEKENVSK